MDSFTGLNAQVLGISVDHIPCLKAWAESLGGIHYPLLSDFWPHGAVAERYGVLRQVDGKSERAIFVIDKKGYIRYIDIHDIDEKPDNEEVRKVLREIEAEDQKVGQASISVPSSPAKSSSFADLQDDEIPQGDIVLFCARWCKDCRKAKAWLDERGLAYVEVDIDYNMAARNQVRRWSNGFLVTPVFDIRGTVILDFDALKLEKTLREKGLLNS
jgi:glutaredoxin